MDTKGNQMKIKQAILDAEEPVTSDFFYDLCNGYLDPRTILDNPTDALMVDIAVRILEQFQESLIRNELVG